MNLSKISLIIKYRVSVLWKKFKWFLPYRPPQRSLLDGLLYGICKTADALIIFISLGYLDGGFSSWQIDRIIRKRCKSTQTTK